MGEGLLHCAKLLQCVSMALKNEEKIKFTMFLFLCVFGGLTWYNKGGMWDNFWNARKYE